MIFKWGQNIPKGQIINSCSVWRWCTWNASDAGTDRLFIFSSFLKETYSQLKGNDSSSVRVQSFLWKERINAAMSWIHVSSSSWGWVWGVWGLVCYPAQSLKGLWCPPPQHGVYIKIKIFLYCETQNLYRH